MGVELSRSGIPRARRRAPRARRGRRVPMMVPLLMVLRGAAARADAGS